LDYQNTLKINLLSAKINILFHITIFFENIFALKNYFLPLNDLFCFLYNPMQSIA